MRSGISDSLLPPPVLIIALLCVGNSSRSGHSGECTEAAPPLHSALATAIFFEDLRMGSKARQRFETRINYFLDDIELVDVLRESILHNDLTASTSKYVLSRVDPQQHHHLQRRMNTPGTRENVINHLRNTVYGSFVKDVYEEITHYLRTILQQCTQSGFDSDRIIGDHKIKVDARTILRMGNWATVCEYIATSLFQQLENERSTKKLLEKMCSKLDLSVPKCMIDNLMPYIEVRHFLVHTDGLVSVEFQRDNRQFNYTYGQVRMDYQFVSDFRFEINFPDRGI